jgi:RNA 2',3'-cyclic 3'-phosphodiesterase
VRLFFALWPPPDTAAVLAGWARDLHEHTGGRVTAEDTIHLTLAFLGDVDAGKAAASARRVRAAPFHLNVEVGRYWRHNKIVWVGPRGLPAALDQLVRQLHGALKEDGFALEERPFAAHITLIRKACAPGVLAGLPVADWPADEFVLMRSVPGGSGSRYEAVERFPLVRA